jgi:N-acetylmuramoyl-L-alanine amidase
MTEYHAFYEIASQTPGAIIETGFMAADRQILLGQQDKVAQGIANGIVCFLETDSG